MTTIHERRSTFPTLERAVGVEPTTASLEGWDSTAELRPPLLFQC